ncbi:hypothetical protein RDI58_014779 [Solanum bulbocastanum]|uniref:Uncharacterized protein n=1 Tax=Solanum bulbocastanum TaxID=147425 RepID=A0AAN8TE28_SOLBU
MQVNFKNDAPAQSFFYH